MKVAIQTNVWSNELHKNNLSQILSEIKTAGYEGFEIGAQRIDLDKPQKFLQLTNDHKLQLAALHIHGELFNPLAIEQAMDGYRKAVQFAVVLNTQHILISGKPKPGKTESDQQNEVAALEQIGKICKQSGLTFCYHNHYWEIEHDYKELRYLCDHTDPGLVSLAIDVGWVHRSGGKPVEAAQLFLDRIRYFHFKDFRVKDFANDTWAELGTGYVDFTGVLEVIQGKGDYWLTVERDETLANAAESAEISRAYLRSLGI